MAEDRVDGIQHFLAGTKILLQMDDPFSSGIAGKEMVFLVKNLGIRQPKTIDGLLEIADKKQISALSTDRMEDSILDPADVLVFIHHDLGKSGSDFLCSVRR